MTDFFFFFILVKKKRHNYNVKAPRNAFHKDKKWLELDYKRKGWSIGHRVAELRFFKPSTFHMDAVQHSDYYSYCVHNMKKLKQKLQKCNSYVKVQKGLAAFSWSENSIQFN